MTGIIVFYLETLQVPVLGLAVIISACIIVGLKLRGDDIQKQLAHSNIKVEQLGNQLCARNVRLDLYQKMFEERGDIIIHRDHNNKLVYANTAFFSLASSIDAPDAVIGTYYDLPGEIAFEPQEVGSALNAGQIGYEQRIETKGGICWIAFTETSLKDEETGKVFHQIIGRDITDKRTAEAASDAKSRFLATVSHEIRTPLNGVLGMAQLLQQTKINAEQKTYVNAIRTSGEALLALIEQILDFSRIESGKFEIISEPFELNTLCESVIELLAPRAQGKGIEIALYVEPCIAKIVKGDAGSLRQILTNLCGNAVKFTDKGGVGISVLRDVDDMLIFNIEDTGIGIAKHRLNHIFEEFEQENNPEASSSEGTGLGLAISKKIVERLNGRLTVKSKPKKGSVFSLKLNLPAAGDHVHYGPVSKSNGKKALIIGKSPFEVQFIAKKLDENGFSTIVRPTIELALSDLNSLGSRGDSECSNVLIVDGAEEGNRAFANLARMAGIKTRIILLSPFEKQIFFETQIEASPPESSFNAWLTKPVRTSSLLQRLSSDGNKFKKSSEIYAKPNIREPNIRKQNLPLHGHTVLLAEDNEINALLAERQLTKAGAAVTIACDGLNALNIYQQKSENGKAFDLVLLDMRMPQLDGLATLNRMKAFNAEHKLPSPRFIALTANAFAEDRAICLKAGFDAFLTKPLDLDELVHIAHTIKIRNIALSI